MTAILEEKCGNCRFWQQQFVIMQQGADPVPEPNGGGFCRRYPAQVVPHQWVGAQQAMVASAAQANAPKPTVYVVQSYVTAMPERNADLHWCGEWELKPRPDA